jgi:hypothetical protein
MIPTITAPPAPPPQQFSSTDGTIQGSIDGTNTVFTVGAPLRRARVSKNGVLMTLNEDCYFAGRSTTFSGAQIPQPGDALLIEGYIQ